MESANLTNLPIFQLLFIQISRGHTANSRVDYDHIMKECSKLFVGHTKGRNKVVERKMQKKDRDTLAVDRSILIFIDDPFGISEFTN